MYGHDEKVNDSQCILVQNGGRSRIVEQRMFILQGSYERLPAEEVSYPFQSISMDVGENYKKENFLVMVDRFTNYTWVKNLGRGTTGTSQEILSALKEQLGTGLLLVEKIHQDNQKSLNSAAVLEWADQYGIKVENSAAYHPGGNLLAERTIGRVKTAMGSLTMKDAMDDILALNLVPRRDESLSPFESMHSLASPVSGIPISPERLKFLTDQTWLKKQEHNEAQIFDKKKPKCPDLTVCFGQDEHKYTRQENLLDRKWVEKIKDKPTEKLESGDRIYFVRRNGHGHGKWA